LFDFELLDIRENNSDVPLEVSVDSSFQRLLEQLRLTTQTRCAVSPDVQRLNVFGELM